MNVLFIHKRKGLFQMTKCNHCGFMFECDYCDAKLVTYRTHNKALELVCHQCQSQYSYPQVCPKCGSTNIGSRLGGLENLVEELEKTFKLPVFRLDKSINPRFTQKNNLAVCLRIFDPKVDYSKFQKIVFTQAENLLSSPDYLVHEDVIKSTTELFVEAKKHGIEIIFDTSSTKPEFFHSLKKLINSKSLLDWYQSFLLSESEIRKVLGFPPYKNLILLTTQEKKLIEAKQKINLIQKEMLDTGSFFSEITVSKPYPAKFLKRKNLFAYHLLIKYPKGYAKYLDLRNKIVQVRDAYKIQARLNPRNLF